MLKSLVSLQQVNAKKPKKSMKIVNAEGENLHIFLNNLRNITEIFRKGVASDNIKIHKKQSFTLSLENTVLEKTTGRGGSNLALLGLNN